MLSRPTAMVNTLTLAGGASSPGPWMRTMSRPHATFELFVASEKYFLIALKH